ncbi:MAG: alpha/beta hydrolase [Bacteroidetes bacterium]|nr:alpha/beta hydrolase [Bacteroidota bacterium]MCB9226520.1 alpha/beta hydrolase [Chitinophagales bacterium]
MKKILIPTILFLLFQSCTQDNNSSTKKHNIAYGSDSQQKMDVYIPTNTEENTPFVVWIHGGGWTAGNKDDDRWIQDYLYNNKIASANINYRLTSTANPNIDGEEIYADVDAAIDYVAAHLNEWGLNNNGFVLAGHSAGGHLALHRGYKYTNQDIKGIASFAGPTDFYTSNSRNHYFSNADLKGMVNRLCGTNYQLGDSVPQAFYDNSPLYFINPDIKVLMVYGTIDNVVPYFQAEMLRDSLQANNANYELVTQQLAGHDLGLLIPTVKEQLSYKFVQFVKSL